MKITTEARSDQINAQDLIGSPRTFTIEGVVDGKAEQKYDVKLQGEARVWRPPLTVLRLLKKCWGDEGEDWRGQRATLYCDESVSFGKEKTGGIRVSHVSGISKPVSASLQVSRGKYQPFTVQPLKESTPQPTTEPWRAQWQAISNALNTAGYEGDGQALLATAGQVIGAEWSHPNQISPEDAQKILAAVREGDSE